MEFFFKRRTLRDRLMRYRHTTTTSVPENNLDPDDGNSWLCSACTLPIFSTPFKSAVAGKHLVHDECADLPKEVTGHALHLGAPLLRISTVNSSSCCFKCKRQCWSVMYKCPKIACGLQLDVLCALQITILHRSHEHRLMAIVASASFICGACGNQHPGFSSLFYLCKACDFWIHPDCASLPNAITIPQHPHSLYLIYSPSDSSLISSHFTCGICRGPITSLGFYFCAKFGYYAHIKCALSDPQSKPVLIRNATGIYHFPMADEHTSVMRYIMENITGSSSDDKEHQKDQSDGTLVREILHPHPLIFHDQDDDSSRVCKACVQFISPPFYRCSQCPDFFLHDCCAYLPSKIHYPGHDHSLFLLPKAPNSSVSGCFLCQSCNRQSINRFAYSCNSCDGFSIDVVCAMMPPSIDHALHGVSHILYMTRMKKSSTSVASNFFVCSCCTNSFRGTSYYECRHCRHFGLHVACAQLPSSSKHKFDDHLLKLTTKEDREEGPLFCEICEDDIKSSTWCYGCSLCDQWFHCDCIHGFSEEVKLGSCIRVNCHDCPLTPIPESTVDGYRCGYCLNAFSTFFKWKKEPAYECSECNFRIHEDCAGKCLLKTLD